MILLYYATFILRLLLGFFFIQLHQVDNCSKLIPLSFYYLIPFARKIESIYRTAGDKNSREGCRQSMLITINLCWLKFVY